MTLTPGTLIQHRYKIVRPVGKGGMGAVYEATDTRLGNTVALKQTLAGNNPQLIKAFEREAKLLASLRHAAITKVIDYFSDEQGQFLVMEYIPGSDLAKLLEERGGPFPVEDVQEWTGQLLKALMYLHRQEPPVIHRDIKPNNLKLTADSEIVLLDFGLAKGPSFQTAALTSGQSLAAYTVQYAPLEQIQGSGTDARSDLYSLGATCYHVLTNVPPDSALKRLSALYNNQTDSLRPPHEYNPHISQAFSTLIMRAMALQADERPDSASEMYSALQAIQQAGAAYQAPTAAAARDNLPLPPLPSPPAGQVGGTTLPLPSMDMMTSIKAPASSATPASQPRASLLHMLQGFTHHVTSVAFSPDGRMLAVGVGDNAVWLWDVMRGQQVRTLPHPSGVASVAFSPDGRTLVSSGSDSTIRLWDVNSGHELRRLTGCRYGVWSVSFNPDGHTLVSGSGDKIIRLWELVGRPEPRQLLGHTERVDSVAFSPNGRVLASGSADHTVRLWDVNSGRELYRLSEHSGNVWVVAFSPDGRMMASGSADHTVRLWDMGNGYELRSLEHMQGVDGLAFAPNGRMLATGSADRTVRLWDVNSGRELLRLQGHTDRVLAVAFNPDGRTLATSSADRTVRLWRLE